MSYLRKRFFVILCCLLFPGLSIAAVVGEWKFDGNGNNEVGGNPAATLVGAASWQATGGISGGYLYVPSDTDWASIAHNAVYDLPVNFTIEFWFRQRSDQSFQQRLVYKGSDPNNYNFNIFRRLWDEFNDGAIIAGYTAAGPSWKQTSNPNDLAHNEWHYVVYVKNGSTQAYYLDGVEIHMSSHPENALTPALPIIVGDSAVDTDFDELRISNHALSEEEIQANYDSLTTEPSPVPTVGEWVLALLATLLAFAGMASLRRRTT